MRGPLRAKETAVKITIDDRAYAFRGGDFEPTIGDQLWAESGQLSFAAEIAADLRNQLEPVRNGVEVINLRFYIRHDAQQARAGGDLRQWTPDDLELEIKAVIAWSTEDRDKVIVSERFRLHRIQAATITSSFLREIRRKLEDKWARMNSGAGHFHSFVEEFPNPPAR